MIQHNDQVTDEYNRPVPAAEIYVYNMDGTVASLTIDGTAALAQPLIADQFGDYGYYADAGRYREDIWYGGKLRTRSHIIIGDPPEFKGDPGGNVMSIGTFAGIPTTTVPPGTSLIQISGTSADGDSGAGRQFIEASEVTNTFVSANPLISVQDATGRGFREIDPRTGTKLVPFLLAIAGQSNAQGANNGGPNPASPMVQTWNGQTSAWGGSDYTQAPWTLSSPDGNAGNNNYALAAAHRIAAEARRPVYIIFDAAGGRPISDWIGSGTASVRYASLKAKVEAALATTQLSSTGITQLDAIIWAQGEEDCQTASFTDYFNDLTTLDAQLRAESWMGEFTPVCVTGMSWTHDRYEVAQAIRFFCDKESTAWVYISTRKLDTPDNTHFSGPALWEVGYNRIAPVLIEGPRFSPEVEPPVFYGYGSGPFTPKDNIPGAIATFKSLASWESRTDGPYTADTFTGDGTTTRFTLNSRSGFDGGVTVNGTALVAGTDYTLPTAGANPYQISFTTAPASGAAIVVNYNTTVNGPAALGSLSWGWRCFADGNWTFAGGYRSVTTQACQYSIAYGYQIFANDSADYSAGFGRDNNLSNAYQLAAGRGHTIADQYGAAIGSFSKYTTAQTDGVAFQVGIGAASGSAANGFAVRRSGICEMPGLPVYADNTSATTGGLIAGQLYRTSTGVLMVRY